MSDLKAARGLVACEGNPRSAGLKNVGIFHKLALTEARCIAGGDIGACLDQSQSSIVLHPPQSSPDAC